MLAAPLLFKDPILPSLTAVRVGEESSAFLTSTGDARGDPSFELLNEDVEGVLARLVVPGLPVVGV